MNKKQIKKTWLEFIKDLEKMNTNELDELKNKNKVYINPGKEI